jgi:hypothetical protein
MSFAFATTDEREKFSDIVSRHGCLLSNGMPVWPTAIFSTETLEAFEDLGWVGVIKIYNQTKRRASLLRNSSGRKRKRGKSSSRSGDGSDPPQKKPASSDGTTAQATRLKAKSFLKHAPQSSKLNNNHHRPYKKYEGAEEVIQDGVDSTMYAYTFLGLRYCTAVGYPVLLVGAQFSKREVLPILHFA